MPEGRPMSLERHWGTRALPTGRTRLALEIEFPEQEVRGLIQNLKAVRSVRNVSRPLPCRHRAHDSNVERANLRRLRPAIQNLGIGGSVEQQRRRLPSIRNSEL